MNLLYYFVFWGFLQIVRGNMIHLKKSHLDKMLRNYDANLRPYMIGSEASPTRVSVNIFIIDIFDVNESKMDYVVQLYLKEIWDDPRLRFPDPEGIVQSIPLSSISKIWTPDFFFNDREGKFHQVQKSNRFVKIFPTGKVAFNSRLTLKMHCPMNFKYFPFDRQTCFLEIESYGFETKDVILKWIDGVPLQVNSKLHISNFILEDFSTGYCDTTTKYGNGCLSVRLQLKRQYGYFLSQIFVPFVLLVPLSWLSLWLDAKAIVLRLSLIIVLLFMMIIANIQMQPLIPPASYTKAIDIWIAACIALVFATLIQFILVNQLARREQKMRIMQNQIMKNGSAKGHVNNSCKTLIDNCSHHIPLSKRIDFICRIIFPVAFVIFNCIFWFTYIKGRDTRRL